MVSKGNDVDQSSGALIHPPTPFQTMLRAMAMDASAETDVFAGDDLLNAILAAETEEEFWDADERAPLNFQHLSGCEISVISLEVKYGRGNNDSIITPFVSAEGKKMYLLAKCVRISAAGEKKIINLPKVGEVFTANTSARYVVTKLWAAQSRGMIDENTGRTLECVVQGTDLGDGTEVLKLRPIPARVTASTVA